MGTPVKQTSQRASSNEELMRAFFDHSSEAAWVLDKEGVITSANHAASLLLSHQKNSGVGLRLTQFIEDSPVNLRQGDFDDAVDFKKLLVNGRLRNAFSYLATGKDELVPVLVSTFWVSDKILVTAQNLSDVLAMEHRLHNTRKELAASGFKATSLLTAGFAHEINNPLTVVLGRLRQIEIQLQSLGTGAADLPKLVTGALFAANRLSSLVEQLRTSYGDTGEEPRSIKSVQKMIDIAVSRCEKEIRAGKVSLLIDCNPDLAVFCTSLISTALSNIITNALQWSGSKSHFYIAIDARLRGDHVSVIVRNNGVSIPETVAAKIFDPFFTTRDVGSGMGLGLTVARSICEQYGGSIDLVESGMPTFEIKLSTRKDESQV